MERIKLKKQYLVCVFLQRCKETYALLCLFYVATIYKKKQEPVWLE